MSGNRRKGLVVQERDLRLFRELAGMRVIDREQAQIVAGFASITRANTRLLLLTLAGLLRRFFVGTAAGGKKALYALTEKSAQLAGVINRGPRRRNDEVAVANFFIQHQLTINEIYCLLKFRPIPEAQFHRWIAFYEPLATGLRLIPDGYVEFTIASRIIAAFLEIDLGNESSKVWKEKVRNYLQFALSGEHESRFGQKQFRVLVIANSERRLHSIRKVVASSTEKIFRFATLPLIQENGFFAPIWFRPKGEERLPLVQQETP
jgi:hypothetical protein